MITQSKFADGAIALFLARTAVSLSRDGGHAARAVALGALLCAAALLTTDPTCVQARVHGRPCCCIRSRFPASWHGCFASRRLSMLVRWAAAARRRVRGRVAGHVRARRARGPPRASTEGVEPGRRHSPSTCRCSPVPRSRAAHYDIEVVSSRTRAWRSGRLRGIGYVTLHGRDVWTGRTGLSLSSHAPSAARLPTAPTGRPSPTAAPSETPALRGPVGAFSRRPRPRAEPRTRSCVAEAARRTARENRHIRSGPPRLVGRRRGRHRPHAVPRAGQFEHIGPVLQHSDEALSALGRQTGRVIRDTAPSTVGGSTRRPGLCARSAAVSWERTTPLVPSWRPRRARGDATPRGAACDPGAGPRRQGRVSTGTGPALRAAASPRPTGQGRLEAPCGSSSSSTGLWVVLLRAAASQPFISSLCTAGPDRSWPGRRGRTDCAC